VLETVTGIEDICNSDGVLGDGRFKNTCGSVSCPVLCGSSNRMEFEINS